MSSSARDLTCDVPFDACSVRDFNIGIECGDTWAYAHGLSLEVVRAVDDTGCTSSMTLYPLRNPDGTPKV